MEQQRHQAFIAPQATLEQVGTWQQSATLLVYRVHQGGIPGVDRCLFLRDVLKHAPVAITVIDHTLRSIQIYGLEWPHESPTQSEPILDSDVQVFHADIAALHQPECLAQQSTLQTVQHEAAQLFVDRDGLLAYCLHDVPGFLDDGGIRPRCAAKLYDGHQIRRVYRVSNQAAGPAPQVFGKRRGRNTGSGAGQHGLWAGQRIQGAEERLLQFQHLGQVFLYIVGVLQGERQVWHRLYARHYRLRIVQ